MVDSNLILTLSKVIISTAWADGEVSHEEINSLKDLLFRLPNITGREWANRVGRAVILGDKIAYLVP